MKRKEIPTMDKAAKLTRDFSKLTDFQKELALAYAHGLTAHDTPVQPADSGERNGRLATNGRLCETDDSLRADI